MTTKTAKKKLPPALAKRAAAAAKMTPAERKAWSEKMQKARAASAKKAKKNPPAKKTTTAKARQRMKPAAKANPAKGAPSKERREQADALIACGIAEADRAERAAALARLKAAARDGSAFAKRTLAFIARESAQHNPPARSMTTARKVPTRRTRTKANPPKTIRIEWRNAQGWIGLVDGVVIGSLGSVARTSLPTLVGRLGKLIRLPASAASAHLATQDRNGWAAVGGKFWRWQA